ncbi:zinc finger protein 3 isoform X10 [Vespula squamosa]|uniref:Zinc finger protein 3 isoform X10 n=1 Tax=Vespula squamosa TaxID=30214 RepID=A0ABD2BMZ9_VESSQ
MSLSCENLLGKDEDVEETTKDTLPIKSFIKKEMTIEENDWMINKDTSMKKIKEDLKIIEEEKEEIRKENVEDRTSLEESEKQYV